MDVKSNDLSLIKSVERMGESEWPLTKIYSGRPLSNCTSIPGFGGWLSVFVRLNPGRPGETEEERRKECDVFHLASLFSYLSKNYNI